MNTNKSFWQSWSERDASQAPAYLVLRNERGERTVMCAESPCRCGCELLFVYGDADGNQTECVYCGEDGAAADTSCSLATLRRAIEQDPDCYHCRDTRVLPHGDREEVCHHCYVDSREDD